MATDGDFDESFFDAPAGEHESDAAGSAPSTPVNTKRKRGPVNSPGTVNDEDEVARRRRRRQSLAFAQRRKSLTLTSSGSKQKSGSDETAPPSSSGSTATVSRATSFARSTNSATSSNNRQYISDMYSTIIKMSSENKINVKNSWSLHLIDHMEDILGSSRKEDEEDPDDTYNFQKASCTLDASIKIYSYRVDDTWNSSYKILENLSRTDDTNSKQQAGSDDEDDDPDEPKSARKASRKAHTAAKTIEKNLNNINLKSYELEFEADPLFHKMSQSFDEGGAKGMLLANLGVYDGCKILLNSSDVGVSTRKPLAQVAPSAAKVVKDEPEATRDVTIKNEVSDPNKRISLASFGSLACFTEDVLSFEVCPPLSRLYEQLDEYYGDEAPQLKVKTTSEHLIKTPVKPKRVAFTDASPVRARLNFDDMDEASQPMEVIEEVDEDAIAEHEDNGDGDTAMDVEMEDAEHTQDFDYGGSGDNDDMGDNDADAAPGGDASQVDGSQLGDGSSQVLPSQVESEFDLQHESVEVVLDPTANAADFFKSRAQSLATSGSSSGFAGRDDPSAYTMMIENALLRSATAGANDLTGANDYSYFDVKMLRNWAGPAHWKFPAVRKVQSKQLTTGTGDSSSTTTTEGSALALMDASDGEDDESSAGKAAKARGAKKPAGESKTVLIDFFAAETADLTLSLKPPRAMSSITMSKITKKHQSEKSAELVFPVDSHVELSVFFQHFMKPKLRFFKKPAGQAPDQNDFVSHALDATYRESESSVKFEDRRSTNAGHDAANESSKHHFGDGNDNDFDFDGPGGGDDDDREEQDLYSTEGLISASRVVEKIDVHYERFAKRVDVKKLKHNIWDHLEKETALLTDDSDAASAVTAAAVDQLSDDFEAQTTIKEPTTFESVVQRVSDRVPPDVTVSFYFICMLHLANEKGLELKGQDDLRNFTIRKEADE